MTETLETILDSLDKGQIIAIPSLLMFEGGYAIRTSLDYNSYLGVAAGAIICLGAMAVLFIGAYRLSQKVR